VNFARLPELLRSQPHWHSYYAARIYLTNKSILTEDGPIPPRTLGLTISRSLSGGLHEDLDITNNSMKPVRFQLEVAFRCDFADIFEVKSGHIVRRGKITTEWFGGATQHVLDNAMIPVLLAN
jgi:hypothetical protein